MMGISIKNFCDGDQVNYSLVVLNGEISSYFQINDKVMIWNQTSGVQHSWPVRNNFFKILIQLKSGTNNLCLKCRNYSFSLTLTYTPIINEKKVRLIYIKCKDSDGKFQAPPDEDNSIESACNRICLAAQMIQTFTAEKLAEQNFPKRTFCLEEDDKTDRPICHIFTSSLSVQEALNLSEIDLWSHFANELMNSSLSDGNKFKFLAFVSFTYYNNPTERIPETYKDILEFTQGHVALGGGGLALFGTGCLHTWAANLQEVVQRFTDQRIIDRKKFMDDSGNRKRYWACYSTGVGATLHELGHTFDLGHSSEGIMGRGFDNLHKFFTMDSWPKGFFAKQVNVQLSTISNVTWCPVANKETLSTNKNKISIETNISLDVEDNCDEKPLKLPHISENFSSTGDQSLYKVDSEAFWSRSSAVILNFHKWLNSFPEEYCQLPVLNGCRITSPYEIRIVEFRNINGMYIDHWEFLEKNEPSEIELKRADVSKLLPKDCIEFEILIEDNYGNILKSKMKIDDCL